MKRILTIISTILLLSAALCVSASASHFDTTAQELSAIGMFRGTANGFELDRAPTRSEAAIMLVRLYGAEDTAKAAYDAGEISHPFTDVSEFTSPYVAWLYTNGITNGTSATTFSASKACTAQNYAAFLLRALGYQDGTDFQYADAASFASTKGLFDLSMLTGTFLRDDLAALTYQALAADLKDDSTYLLDSLIQRGAIDAAAAQPITKKIETYRTLTTSGAAMQNGLDTDITAKLSLDVASSGKSNGAAVNEQQSMDMSGSGKVQMILSETNPQAAMTMQLTVKDESMDLTMDMGMWLKDGWLYVRSAGTSYKMDVSQQMGEMMSLYQQLADQTSVQASAAMLLPYIDTITTQKNGSNTVYTLTLNNAMEGLIDELVDTLTPMLVGAGLDFTLDMKLENVVKNATAAAAITMKANVDMDAENTVAVTVKMDMDIGMKINAVGKDVKVTYPADLSSFPDISDVDALPTATAAA
jgi:hypothetical protein